MKNKNFIILLALIYSIFYFSPQITGATEEEMTADLEQELLEESEELESVEKSDEIELEEEITDELVEVIIEDEQKDPEEQIAEELEEQENDNVKSNIKAQGIDAEENIEKEEVKSKEPGPLKNGSRDKSVIALKHNLGKLGFAVRGKGTALFGSETEKKVKEFQSRYSLTANGMADKETLAKIEEVLSSPFLEGKRHNDTIQLKKNLAALGFAVPGKGTALYGKDTVQKVKEFQTFYDLQVSGIVDQVMLNRIKELLDGPLSNRMYREDVKELKSNLGKLGFMVPGKGTTLFGPSTEKKVREFQAHYELEITGVVDEITQAEIKQVLSSPFQKGKRHNDTIQLKKDLAALGFAVPGNGTTLYGKKTAKKVREFQSFYDLKVSGIVDQVMLNRIKELLDGPLSNRMYREDVKELKSNLGKLGFTVPGKGTTLFGPSTEKKVKEFQAYYELEITGVVDEITQAKIEEVLSGPFEKGKRHNDTIQLKKDLATLGFAVPGNGTALYGKNTAKKVREFQSFYDLKVSGIVDQVMLNKIKELLDAPLSNGMHREDVKVLKRDLDKLGFTVPGKGTTLFGSGTEKKLKEFQSYYGLNATGVVDETTQAKIKVVLSSSFQDGKRHNDTIQLKKDLAALGFRVPGKGTTLYGKNTAKKVNEFQSYYNLIENGIADEVTLVKIAEILSNPLQNGQRHEITIQLKKDLAKLRFRVPGNGTSLYGKETEKKVKEFQSYYGLKSSGIADEITLAKIKAVLSSPLQNGKRHKDTIQLKKDLAIVGYPVSGKGTSLFGTETEKRVKEFQKDKKLKVSGIADEVTLKVLAQTVKISKIKIFIDPGHGGKDPGAQSNGLQEKTVVLDIALKAAEILAKKYLGVEVNLSRTTDKFIELEDRAQMANDWGADYFISIHNNAHTGSANGFESFIHNGNVSKETKDKQKQIHEYLIKQIGVTDRGMKDANFSVLRNTTMPAILIEYLFIDNPKENALLKDKKYRNWLGEITANAIANAFSLKKR